MVGEPEKDKAWLGLKVQVQVLDFYEGLLQYKAT